MNMRIGIDYRDFMHKDKPNDDVYKDGGIWVIGA